MRDILTTITNVPTGEDPIELAELGERFGYEANGDAGNPPPQAWARAGVAASIIIRASAHGHIPAALLVALIADVCDPMQDDVTPQRKALIDGHTSAIGRERIANASKLRDGGEMFLDLAECER